MDTEQARKEKRMFRLPILLSAIVCPGAGQFAQKRWAAGLLFSGGFLVGFFWLLFAAGKIIISYYRMAFDLEYEPETPDLRSFIPPVTIALIFYLFSLFDVVQAQFRILRNRAASDALQS